jgi:hypothetical protein
MFMPANTNKGWTSTVRYDSNKTQEEMANDAHLWVNATFNMQLVDTLSDPIEHCVDKVASYSKGSLGNSMGSYIDTSACVSKSVSYVSIASSVASLNIFIKALIELSRLLFPRLGPNVICYENKIPQPEEHQIDDKVHKPAQYSSLAEIMNS